MRKNALIVGLAILFAISAFAQSSSITGAVADPSGKVIPGAVVKLTFELNGEMRSTVTDENGDFGFNALGAGTYTIRVEAAGFRPTERKGTNLLSASRLALGTHQIGPATFTLVRILSGALTLTLLLGGRRTHDFGNWRSAAALFAYAALFSFAYVRIGAGARRSVFMTAIRP